MIEMHWKLLNCFVLIVAVSGFNGHIVNSRERTLDESVAILETFLSEFETEETFGSRIKRDDSDRGVTNLDIRDAILQLLNVIREGNKKLIQHDKSDGEVSNQILKKLNTISSTESVEKKIDNISTFLLRMSGKLDDLTKRVSKGGIGGGRGTGESDPLITLAQESFDILTILPTYIESTKEAIGNLSTQMKFQFDSVEKHLFDETEAVEGQVETKSLAKALKKTEAAILGASNDLKDVVTESGQMAESLMEKVNDGHKEMTEEIKGLSNLEKVLMETADSIIETKRKMEFGFQSVNFKIGDLLKASGGDRDAKLRDQLTNITSTILSNQTQSLNSLTEKVEKELSQVWRQMGIMYGQVSSSISILEKVKSYTENYVNKTGSNLGTMEGQVSGLSDRIVDVDQNLNYMLGQLSLVVKEFNVVKTGLSEAMNGISDDVREYKTPSPDSTAAPVETN